MQQISISEIQRNLHKLDNFDIIEVIENKLYNSGSTDSIAGSLHKYANPSLIESEDRGWQEHLEEKHQI